MDHSPQDSQVQTRSLLLPEEPVQSRRTLLGAGLGTLALAASGLLPAAGPAEAAKHRARKRRRRRRKHGDGNGLLRNFSFKVVNNSNRDWWLGVGWQGFLSSDIPQQTVAKHSTRQFVVENDEAVIFVPNGSNDQRGNPLGRLVGFSNPAIPEVHLMSYSDVTYFAGSKSIHADTYDIDSDQDMKVGGTRTFNFGFVTFDVRREQDSQKYKEFTITFS